MSKLPGKLQTAVATISEETGAQVKVVAQAVGETTITVSCGELEPVTVSVKVVHDERRCRW